MKIKLITLLMENFKGVHHAEYDFEGDTMVCGDNGTGKTTIYDAYLWCIFGSASQPNTQVQPIIDGEIEHGWRTTVTAYLLIDDKKVQITRHLVEKWKDINGEKKLEGTEIQRFINNEPLQKKQYLERLATLADMEHWRMLSSIGSFMSLKVDDRRSALLNMVDINTDNIIDKYPVLKKELEEKNSSDVESVRIAAKYKKDELDKIIKNTQAHKSTLEKTIQLLDFRAIKDEIASLDETIKIIDDTLQANTDVISASEEYRTRLNKLNTDIIEFRQDWEAKRDKQIRTQLTAIDDLEKAKTAAEAELQQKDELDNEVQQKIKELKKSVQSLKAEWVYFNSSEFTYTPQEVCPTCGQHLTQELQAEAENQAKKEFFCDKQSNLNRIQEQAQQAQERRRALSNASEKYTNQGRQALVMKIKSTENTIKEAKKTLVALESQTINECEPYNELRRNLSELIQGKPTEDKNIDVARLKREKASAQKKRDNLIAQLSQEERNEEIRAKIEEDNKEIAHSLELLGAQVEILEAVKDYKRECLKVAESEVNALFSTVRWKFSEATLKGGEKDICQCMVNGIDYNALNNAARVSAGVDIIASLSKVFNLYAPIFIDNRESVRVLPQTENQQISLKVTEDKVIRLLNI